MNNTVHTSGSASACGVALSSPDKHSSLFFSSPLFSSFLPVSLSLLPEADSDTSTCRTGERERLCHPTTLFALLQGDGGGGRDSFKTSFVEVFFVSSSFFFSPKFTFLFVYLSFLVTLSALLCVFSYFSEIGRAHV